MAVFFVSVVSILKVISNVFDIFIPPPFTFFFRFFCYTEEARCDAVIMLTNKLDWSSIMFLDTSLGKELINWERLLFNNLYHSSQLGSWVLKWGVWLLSSSLRVSMSMTLCLVLILLISQVLTVRLLIPPEREGDQ